MFKLRRVFLFLAIFLLVSFSFLFAAEEKLTITTYYPSPYGSYNELSTAGNTYLATTTGAVMIGPVDEMPIEPEKKLYVIGNASIGPIYEVADPAISSILFIGREEDDYGPAKTSLYAYRYGSGDVEVSGTNFTPEGMDSAITAYSEYGNTYSAAIAGYSWLDYTNSAAILGGERHGEIWGALGFNDGANNWAGYFMGDGDVTAAFMNGHVGIGTAEPGAKLEVNGSILFTYDASYDRVIGMNDLEAQYGSTLILSGGSNWDDPVAGSYIKLYGINYDNGMLLLVSGNDGGLHKGDIVFRSGSSEYMRIKGSSGNVGIGTTNPGGGSSSNILSIANTGISPTANADMTHLYSSGGEGFWMDGAGNISQQTPHDPETGEWIFYSKNTKTGRVVRVNMEQLVKAVEEVTGKKFMFESQEFEN